MDKINIKFYKTIEDICNSNSFDVYTMKLKDGKEEAYLSIGNNTSKSIDIYKINSKDDFKFINTIKFEQKNISAIKYFYDHYKDFHYLTALTNDNQHILIWKIINESKYDLIFNHNQIRTQGGFISSRRPVRFNYYNLIFSKEKSFLIVSFILQQGCTHRESYLTAIKFLNHKKAKEKKNNIKDEYDSDSEEIENSDNSDKCYFFEKYDEENEEDEYSCYFPYYDNKFLKVFQIQKDGNDYLAVLQSYTFRLYSISSISNTKKKYKKKQHPKKIKNYENIIKPSPNIITDGVLINENKGDSFFYYCQIKYNNNDEACYIWKFDMKFKQSIYKAKVNINPHSSISISAWNKKYLLLYINNGKNIYLFNTIKGLIENKFCNGKWLLTCKKIKIKKNEELYFSEYKNKISLWVPGKYEESNKEDVENHLFQDMKFSESKYNQEENDNFKNNSE